MSNRVDLAIVAALEADTALMQLMPGGVYFDFAPRSAGDQFVLLELYDHSDVYQFQTRAFEEFQYSITAVEKNAAALDAEAARVRIDAVLQDVLLTIDGYAHAKTQRQKYLRFSVVDDNDRANRWQHRGGRYLVVVSPN